MSLFIDPKWKETLRLAESDTHALSVKLAEKRSDIIDRLKRDDRLHHRYAPLYLPFETSQSDQALRVVETMGTPKLVVLIGIGGSSLGTEAIAHALGLRDKLMVFDTVIPEKVEQLEVLVSDRGLEREDVVVVVISKSGTTAETVANTVAIRSVLESRFGDFRDRIVAISDEGTPLESLARENGWTFHAMPTAVGGRYSVMSTAGLIPLALLGVDIKAFLAGAKKQLEDSWKRPVGTDVASTLAVAEYLYHQKGMHQEVNFFFSPVLETLGKWHRQLIAESTGKTEKGKRYGWISSVAIGTTDLHSIQQYIADGPRDMLILLTTVRAKTTDAPVVYKGKTLLGLRDVIIRGLKASYRESGVPFIALELTDLSVKTLGAYMAAREEETVLLSHLLGIDPFNQPGVENYKTHTRSLLGKD